MISKVYLPIVMGLVTVGPTWADLTDAQVRELPPPAAEVDFQRDIVPLLEQRCVKCHGRGKSKGGFRLDDRELLLQGGDSGPAVVPGNSAQSYFLELVAGVDPDNVMPQKGTRLTRQEVGLIRAWIDRGAVWSDGVAFEKQPPRNMSPQRPSLPRDDPGSSHPVDLLLRDYFRSHDVTTGDVVDDRSYARRVYLDLIGVLPNPEELAAFLSHPDPGKREALVERLLNDRQRYAEHWLSFWNDLLRNDYKGTGFIDNGRKQISTWLFKALKENRPYDEFVRELVSPSPESEGFIKGIVWRGVVNASQRPEMQAAQNISQVFMGVNLKCASCHDSFINDWTLAEAYGLANVFASQPLEVFRCDQPTGKVAATQFLFPELGTIDSDAPRERRLGQLAGILTGPENGRFSRTIVNRLWSRFLGRGLVEPLDDMEQPAWNPDLLDWLAEDLADHDFDLQRTMKLILTSRAYQMPSVNVGERVEGFVFRGPAIRRMSAEQFRDALATLTGVWSGSPAVDFGFESSASPSDIMEVPAKWVWSHGKASARARPETIYLRREATFEGRPDRAMAVVTCDNGYVLWVNGRRVKAGDDFRKPGWVDLRPFLKAGLNVFALEATNDTSSGAKPGEPDDPREWNPAGAFFYAMIRGGERSWDVGTDRAWVWSREAVAGWTEAGFDASAWKVVSELGAVDAAPWGVGQLLGQALRAHRPERGTRAALVTSDALTTALGRPPREQVVTRRASAATPLQALELTNGETLNELLKGGARNLLAAGPVSARGLIEDVYLRGLGRVPTPAEEAVSVEFLGEEVDGEGVEDFLWSVVMLPEFQLIY